MRVARLQKVSRQALHNFCARAMQRLQKVSKQALHNFCAGALLWLQKVSRQALQNFCARVAKGFKAGLTEFSARAMQLQRLKLRSSPYFFKLARAQVEARAEEAKGSEVLPVLLHFFTIFTKRLQELRFTGILPKTPETELSPQVSLNFYVP